MRATFCNVRVTNFANRSGRDDARDLPRNRKVDTLGVSPNGVESRVSAFNFSAKEISHSSELKLHHQASQRTCGVTTLQARGGAACKGTYKRLSSSEGGARCSERAMRCDITTFSQIDLRAHSTRSEQSGSTCERRIEILVPNTRTNRTQRTLRIYLFRGWSPISERAVRRRITKPYQFNVPTRTNPLGDRVPPAEAAPRCFERGTLHLRSRDFRGPFFHSLG